MNDNFKEVVITGTYTDAQRLDWLAAAVTKGKEVEFTETEKQIVVGVCSAKGKRRGGFVGMNFRNAIDCAIESLDPNGDDWKRK